MEADETGRGCAVEDCGVDVDVNVGVREPNTVFEDEEDGSDTRVGPEAEDEDDELLFDKVFVGWESEVVWGFA